MINKIKDLTKQSIKELDYLLNDLENIKYDIDEYINNVKEIKYIYESIQTMQTYKEIKQYLINEFNPYINECNTILDDFIYKDYYWLYNNAIFIELENDKDIKEWITKAID